jgi:Uma2 family endonuclease
VGPPAVGFAEAREHPGQLSDPRVVIEVLSPSTVTHDRGLKVTDYRRLSSVQEIVLISASAVAAEVWRRGGRGWTVEEVSGPDGTLELSSIAVEMRLAEIYDGLVTAGPPPARRRR